MSHVKYNISELARELGVTAPQLYQWRKEYDEFGQGSFPGNDNLKQTPEQERTAGLTRKLKDVQIKLLLAIKHQELQLLNRCINWV